MWDKIMFNAQNLETETSKATLINLAALLNYLKIMIFLGVGNR